MKKRFQKIWDLAEPYQDKRGDRGHAKVVTSYAVKLVDKLDGDEDIVVPAAILHDIGWSQVPKEKWERIIKGVSKKEEVRLREAHQKEGVKLAKDILSKINYPSEKREEIFKIISRHDTGRGYNSHNEGLVRDADKLWRFVPRAFYLDAKRYSMTPEERYKKLKKDINIPGFFYSEVAKEMAQEELEKTWFKHEKRLM